MDRFDAFLECSLPPHGFQRLATLQGFRLTTRPYDFDVLVLHRALKARQVHVGATHWQARTGSSGAG